MKKLILLVTVAASLIVSFGCKSTRLEPGGSYAPTNELGQAVFSDTGLLLADSSYRFAYTTVLSVFKFERDNRAQLWALSPAIKKALDEIRPNVVNVDKRWAMARQVYKANPTPANLSTLQTILEEIQRLIPVVQQQISPAFTSSLKQP